MAFTKGITVPSPAQQAGIPGRSKSALDWNLPRKPRTPRGEYRFMRNYSLLCIPQKTGSFGPINGGGVAQ
jgi:hypothetical protein